MIKLEVLKLVVKPEVRERLPKRPALYQLLLREQVFAVQTLAFPVSLASGEQTYATGCSWPRAAI